MSKELKISIKKDDVLRMAKDRMDINKSDCDTDKYTRICGIAHILKEQGYINISETTGSISLWITPASDVFLENGGFHEEKMQEKKKNINKKLSDLLMVLSGAIIGAIIQYLYSKYIN